MLKRLKRGDEPEDGGYHRRSNGLGLLRLVDCFRPVILWNMIGVVINFVNVGAYLYFVGNGRQ